MRRRTGLWLAFSSSIALHAVILLLPAGKETPPFQASQPRLSIELTTVRLQAPLTAVPETAMPTPPPQPVPEPVPEPLTEPSEKLVEKQTEARPVSHVPDPPIVESAARNSQRELDSMSDLEKSALTSTILARQYITEESAAEQLFGKPLVQDSNDFQKEFHYPHRPNLLEMLDQPLPDVPFAYTPGLVHFAYEPGIKGEVQRFWDFITPEFGWRTKYGTEVKCGLLLVIIACGWK